MPVRNNAIIQYCQIIDCNAAPGLGNSGGGAGDGGDSGSGASGGTGGTGGGGRTVTTGGTDSGWIKNANYSDDGLTPGVYYSYRYQIRYSNNTLSPWSRPSGTTAGGFTPGGDPNNEWNPPPTPDPYNVRIINMGAIVSSDPYAYYFFDYNEPASGGGAGADGRGGGGGGGGKGGDGSTNGNTHAGGIYSGDNCNIQISDTTFSDNYTTTKVASFEYNAGNGGDGGNGGSDPGNIGGDGGNGGDGGHAGNAGDGIYIGNGGNGGDGGDGGGDEGDGGHGGNGSASNLSEKEGQGGQGGTGNPDGLDGKDGAVDMINFFMSSYAGSNHYGQDCTATLNNCNFLKNYTAGSPGGAEYYKGGATATMNNCTFSENSAGGGGGGAQFFAWMPNNNIDINDCTYNKNTAVWDGGAVFAGYNVNLTVTDSTFADNVALGTEAYGGGICWDNHYYYHNKTASITNSYFTNNTAGFGGGLHWYDDYTNTTMITNCVFADNSADHGGGLYWSNGEPNISGCIFKRNHANGRWVWLDNWTYSDFFGGGGAIFGFTSSGTIKDCTITDNTTSGSGGGVYLGGGDITPKLHNCLIANNSAVLDGGGIASYWFVSPQITNCTVADNTASDPVNSNHGRGGGISCSYQSKTTMKDCILADNAATWGNQISIGNNSDPVNLQRPAELTISYSDIQNWHDANQIYIFPDRILNIDANNVIDDDPCFVQTYFLATNSPCIDTGSDDSNDPNIGLNTYTTQTDSSPDTGTVDMGYHYALKRLTLVIIGHGTVTVDPNNYDPNGTYLGGIFALIATPDAGYRVKSWTGADNTPYWNINTNTVTMTVNKTVTVEFEVEYNKTINVYGDFPGIQSAIDQAQNGDTIRIHDGTYVGTGFTIDRKNITILGNPTHPENVVIDCAGEWPDIIRKGFVLVGDNQHWVILNGLTIANSDANSITPLSPRYVGDDGLPTKLDHDIYDDMSFYGGAITIQGNHSVKNCIIRNCSVSVDPATDGNPGGDPNDDDTAPGHHKGGDGGYGGNAGGGGIYIQWGNARIINVTIEDCQANAGYGGNGTIGYEDTADNYPPGASGKGGDGGSAFGAGIYVRSGSPYFENVTVRSCIARAGNGGNGSIGAFNVKGADGGLSGRVKGAGIYCSVNSAPQFVNCTVENCRAYGGRAGNGGDAGPFDPDIGIDVHGGYGGLTTEADASQGDIRIYSSNGGAVFCDNWSRATFTDCAFIGNMTYGSISGLGGFSSPSRWQSQPRQNFRVPSFGAGVFCSTDSSTTFSGCQFRENKTAYNQDFTDPNYLAAVGLADINDYNGDLIGCGGGLCLWQTNTTTITDCNFITNAAPVGGGIYGLESEMLISDCNVSNNISYSGGGILAVDSMADITKSLISQNIAGTQPGSAEDTGQVVFGTGGGIYSLSTVLNITDTTITENYARFTAGGICLDGDTPFIGRPAIKNCLITNNRATEAGGGIAAMYFAEPFVQNCTIAENYATDANGTGGGLFASYAADVIVKDTIFRANSGVDGSQIALSNDNSDMPANLTITYSDIDLRVGIDLNSLELDSGSDSGTTSVLVDSQTIYNEINSSGSAKVIVSLAEPTEMRAVTNWNSPASVSALQSEIATRQTQVLSTISGGEFTLRYKLANTTAFSGQVTQAGLNKLLAYSAVTHIEPVRTVHPMTAQGIPLMNALNTRGVYNGQGISVAIVDSGVDYTHPRLGGGGFPNSKVIGGYDFGNNDSNPMPSSEAHGTCCAGLAAGSLGTVGDYIGGVAYNAKIYALKLTTDAGLWPTDSALAAWDWCITHRNDNSANPIKVISNSWGTTWYTNNHAEADAFSPAHTMTAQTAVAAGITILAASGNEYQTNGIIWPAAMSNVISVGAVYDAVFVSQACGVSTQPDKVTCYSNTADILDILASSENAYTTDIVGTGGYSTNDYYPYFNGTSSACPYAAGAVAALQNAVKQTKGIYLTPAQVRGILKMTGEPITDTKVTITKPRVNLGSAIALLTSSVPIHAEQGCTITGLEQDINDVWTISSGSNNISDDPNFARFGYYYLSHKEAGQDYNSPCFDIGSDTAANLHLDTYTTRTDGVNDVNIVDLGYHYTEGLPRYELQIDINTSPTGTGALEEPWLPGTYNLFINEIVRLHAIPDANSKVVMWILDGVKFLTNDNYFSVTMNGPHNVAVQFEAYTPPPPKSLHVPDEYPSLQHAINAANDGDKIILAKGIYFREETNYDYGAVYINGKNITITGSNPDDPCVVAQTILQENGFRIFNVDRTMILDGITIQDAHYYAGDVECSEVWAHGPTGDGYNGYSIFGGAVALYNASPTIRNCRFVRCSALASNACDGTGDAGDGGWAGWAWGGAVAIDSTSNPIFKNCEFIDCYARGSNAGNGSGDRGHGGNWGDPNGGWWHDWDFGPYEEYWYYSGYGGAIYCMDGSKSVFENCLFRGNRSYGGVCGVSGDDNIGGYPMVNYAIDSFGGAVYMADGSDASFTNCNFIDNEADTRNQIVGDVNTIYNDNFVLYDSIVSYGGGICAQGDAKPVLKNCSFTNNRACAGGAIYSENSIANISKCTFENCASMLGGGVSLADSNSILSECDFSNNQAISPPERGGAGQGGAIYCASSAAKFYDCEINNNQASASGGGAYFKGELESNMHNCLIANNSAGRDGGGVSANWYVQLTLSNCTVADNSIIGGGFASGYGGGLSCAYEAHANVINSIFWNNNAQYGSSISIGNNFAAADKLPAEVNVSYSDIRNGIAGVFADANHGCILNWNAGNLAGTSLTSPLFVTGFWGNYYLSQIATNDPCQTADSPCVDAGLGSAISNSMYRHTTRTDHVIDIADSNVDMGYHYTLPVEILGDFDFDGDVDLEDLALFMLYWLEDDCTFPYWCYGTDLNEDGKVDFEDYARFAENYGEIETTPPQPNPMTWAIEPRSAGLHEIAMTATTATDHTSGSYVQYYFECNSPGCHNKDWTTNSTYVDTGLATGTLYGYRVKARDAHNNETGWSDVNYATPSQDTNPPEPDPMTWATDGEPNAISSTSIRMVATTATDDTSGVEYYFDCVSTGCHDCNWQSSTVYVDSGLTPDTTYTYRVKARDTSTAYNETQFSDPCSATTLPTGPPPPPPPPVDTTPPTPNPSQWATYPQLYYVGDGYVRHQMAAVAATDASLPVMYYFQCLGGGGTSSGWITSPTYMAGPFLVENYSAYRVYTKDALGNVGSPSPTYHILYGLIP